MDFRVFTRRWGHYDVYQITRNPSGWHIEHMVHSGDCDPKGEPYLYRNFRQDLVSYPHNLSNILEILWNHADELTENELQEKINDIAEWVSACERAHPSWDGYY